MARKEIFTCDIEGCENTPGHKDKKMQVIFNTEQTEGRNVPPYLSEVTIDICDNHMNELLKDRKYIVAHGAMGYNKYNL